MRGLSALLVLALTFLCSVIPANAFAPVVLAEPVAAAIANGVLMAESGAVVATVGTGGQVVMGTSAAATAIATLIGAAVGFLRLGDKFNIPLKGVPNTSQSQMPASTSESVYCPTSWSTGCGTVAGQYSGSWPGACDLWIHSSDGMSCTVSGRQGTFQGVMKTNVGTCTYKLMCNTSFGSELYLDNQSTGISQGSATYTKTVSDGRPSLKKDTNGWSRDTADPDTSTSVGTIPSGGAPLRVTGRDSAGNPVSVTVTPDANNGVRIDHATQAPDANGVPTTTVRTVQTDSNGKVSNAYQVSYNNTTIVNGDVVNNSTVNSAIAPQTGGSGTQTQVINFPDDYAREATQQSQNAKLDTLHADLSTLHQDLTNTATAPSDPAARPSSDIADVFFSGTFAGLQGWTFPARSVACPTASFSLWSSTFTVDAHCTLFSNVQSTISAVMLAVWTIVALFIVLGA